MKSFKNKDKNYKVKLPNPKRFLQYCSTAILPLCLSGCMGIYEGGFECPPGKGVGCKSISEVNEMVDQKNLPEKTPPDLPHTSCEQCGSQDPQITPHSEKPSIWYSPWVLREA